eukprot:NODE_2789_length_447_cov_543.281407_g2311_i0.p1 GENE.NODE_2789_length_447_cov_543.281407_g2311_i0~~NODE_2789_length_447_cov_543.281407_g2311_i0.p1  ORF type:complete len:123 (-),score=9.10 NODE_2789_length_447_cov_543.281407_g2311_i0:49-417(-)
MGEQSQQDPLLEQAKASTGAMPDPMLGAVVARLEHLMDKEILRRIRLLRSRLKLPIYPRRPGKVEVVEVVDEPTVVDAPHNETRTHKQRPVASGPKSYRPAYAGRRGYRESNPGGVRRHSNR